MQLAAVCAAKSPCSSLYSLQSTVLRPTTRLSVASGPLQPGVEAVWIPLDQLLDRIYELPPPGAELLVDDAAAIPLLLRRGYLAVVTHQRVMQDGRFRLWSPNPTLEAWVRSLDTAKALDVGCGSGRDAVHLADLGWDVTAVDRLPDAIGMARALEMRYLAKPGIEWLVDNSADLAPRTFDLAVVSMGPWREFSRNASQFVKPGGNLFVEAYESERILPGPDFEIVKEASGSRSKGPTRVRLYRKVS